MPEKTEGKTLLKSLLDCFSSAKSIIKYVVEHEINGRKRYELPLDNVVEWWKLLFSKNIVALSIAPRSQTKQLSKDTLSSFVRYVINDKNNSVVEKNFIPHFAGPRCRDLISEEVTHLEHTLDLGVRAAHSPWDNYADSISCERMKESSEVQIHYEDALKFLMQLFMGIPYEILLKKYSWFADCISLTSDSKPVEYTSEQIISIFACALILCLNITELPQINDNIEAYIKSVLSFNGDGEGPTRDESAKDSLPKEAHTSESVAIVNSDSNRTNINTTIKKAALKINLYEIQQGRKPLGVGLEPVIMDIIDSIMEDLYADILRVSAQLWQDFNIEQKAQTILKAYIHELRSISDLSLSDANSRI